VAIIQKCDLKEFPKDLPTRADPEARIGRISPTPSAVTYPGDDFDGDRSLSELVENIANRPVAIVDAEHGSTGAF
jgi:hypothetical protein